MRCPVCRMILAGTAAGVETHYRFKHPERSYMGKAVNPKPPVHNNPVALYFHAKTLLVMGSRRTGKGGWRYRANPQALKTYRHRRRLLASSD